MQRAGMSATALALPPSSDPNDDVQRAGLPGTLSSWGQTAPPPGSRRRTVLATVLLTGAAVAVASFVLRRTPSVPSVSSQAVALDSVHSAIPDASVVNAAAEPERASSAGVPVVLPAASEPALAAPRRAPASVKKPVTAAHSTPGAAAPTSAPPIVSATPAGSSGASGGANGATRQHSNVNVFESPQDKAQMNLWSVRFALLFAAHLASVPAWAGGKEIVPLARSLTGAAKEDYESAQNLSPCVADGHGDSAGALVKYQHAYELSKDARLLWNMAACEIVLTQYASAHAHVGQYLKEVGRLATAEERKEAINTQDALRKAYSTVNLSGDIPDGAAVLLNGSVAAHTPLAAPLAVNLGDYTLRVEQAGFAPFETTLRVPGNTEITVPVALERAAIAKALPARLSITTSGERDTISVDSKVVASQHWEGQLLEGEHTVRVTATGKKPYESHLQLTAGSTRSLQITLENEANGAPVWLWVAGGAVVVAGAAVGGYFLLDLKTRPALIRLAASTR